MAAAVTVVMKRARPELVEQDKAATEQSQKGERTPAAAQTAVVLEAAGAVQEGAADEEPEEVDKEEVVEDEVDKEEVAEDVDDEPVGEIAGVEEAESGTRWWIVALAIAAGALLGSLGGVLIWQRRRRRA